MANAITSDMNSIVIHKHQWSSFFSRSRSDRHRQITKAQRGGGGGGVGVCCCCRSWRVYELSCNEQLYSSDVAIVRIYNPGRNYSIQRLQRRADGSRRASGMQASIFGVRLEGECAVGLLTQKDHFEDLTPITNTEILEGETPKLF